MRGAWLAVASAAGFPLTGCAPPDDEAVGARGAAVVDQSFTSPTDLGGNINECCRYVAQTFTAGLTGNLDGVNVDVASTSPFPLRVEIRPADSGVPDAAILGETTLSTPDASPGQLIAFPAPVPVVAGQRYAIVVSYPDAPSPGPGQHQGVWYGATGDGYPGGAALSSVAGATWNVSGPDHDVHFRTHVDPAPLPTVVDAVFPDPDMVGVGTNTPLIIRLNRDVSVDGETTDVTVHRADDHSVVESFHFGPFDFADRRTAIARLASPLAPGSRYYVAIERKALRVVEPPFGFIGDYTSYPGGDADHPDMWAFSTGSGPDPSLDIEIPAPLPSIVDSVVPAVDAVDVPLDTLILITMNKTITVDQWTTGIALHRADGSLVESIRLVPAHLSSPYLVAAALAAPLEPSTTYYIVIHRKAVRVTEAPWGYIGDYSPYIDHNPVNPKMWRFTTRTATGQ